VAAAAKRGNGHTIDNGSRRADLSRDRNRPAGTGIRGRATKAAGPAGVGTWRNRYRAQ
jgi:hypothetical protein